MRPFRRMLPYVLRYRGAFVLGTLFVIAATAATLAMPKVLGHAINRLDQGGASKEFILRMALAFVLFAAVRGLFLFLARGRIMSASRWMEFDIRNDLFAHLEALPARWYDAHATGDVTSRAINDVEGVRMMIGVAVYYVVSSGLMFAATLTQMFLVNPGLAGLCAVPLALITLVMAGTGWKIHGLSLAVQEQLGVLSSRAQENFSGARVVRAFVQEEHEIERYRVECAEYRERNLRLARWRALTWALVILFSEIAIAITLYAGGKMIMAGTLSKGAFAEFLAYQFMLLWPMIAIGWVINIIQRGLACLSRLVEVLDAPVDADAVGTVSDGKPIEGLIEARSLTFSYAPDRPPALSNVSLRIEPGQKTAIVGRTGAGKSTFAQLLLRLYRPPAGTLFIDGRDVLSIPLAELRGAIGAVPQDLFLFSDRLRENIAFGGIDGVADEGVARAAEISRLAADIDRFPERYEQVIGERGVTLSGGQKQRTALARAIIRQPRILILDDALSSVDSHTEREIRDRLREFVKGRTCLVITHRLSAITDADRIFVLEAGRLIEEGRHEELLARDGAYARLWESQKLAEELAQT